MTATLVTADSSAHGMAPAPNAALLATRLGASPVLTFVLDVALGGEHNAAAESDGVLAAIEGWPGEVPPHEVALAVDRLCDAHLHGRPVGVIVVAVDVGQGARNLSWIRAVVRRQGGLPVGTGICVDSADILKDESGWTFTDVTLPASLALLARRVHTLARSRRVLRAA